MCRSFVPSPASAITPLVIVSSYTSSMMRIFNPIKMQSILPHYLSLLRLMFESSEVIQTWQDKRLLAGMIVLRSRAYSKACLKDEPSFYMSRDHAAGCKRTQITDWRVYISRHCSRCHCCQILHRGIGNDIPVFIQNAIKFPA